MEHETLLKAKADFEVIKGELDALNAAHAAALKEATEKIKELEEAASRATVLEEQVAALKAEKEETANKLSELEVEILELKETAEKAEDEQAQALARTKELEEQIARAVAASEQTLIEAKKKDEGHELTLKEVHHRHEEALKAASDEQEKLAAKLKELEDDLVAAGTRHEQALADAKAAEEAHSAKLQETENLHIEKADELSAEIKRLSEELAVRDVFLKHVQHSTYIRESGTRSSICC